MYINLLRLFDSGVNVNVAGQNYIYVYKIAFINDAYLFCACVEIIISRQNHQAIIQTNVGLVWWNIYLRYFASMS